MLDLIIAVGRPEDKLIELTKQGVLEVFSMEEKIFERSPKIYPS